MTAVESAGAKRLERYPSQPVATAVSASPGRGRAAEDVSAKALTFAGSLLAPERGESQEPRLARLLLREAFVGAARALTGEDSLASVREAHAALEARQDLARAFKGQRQLASCLALESETPPDTAQLLEVEAVVGELLRLAGRAHRSRRGRRWLLASASSCLAALVVAIPRLHYTPAWFAYEWQASSAEAGYPKSGTLGQHHQGLVFHTGLESGPSVLIDMKARHSIAAIVIKNRSNCCTDRGLPLIVEAGNTKEALAFVGRKAEVFDEWTLTFVPREARYVRLRAEANTYLQLRDVAIR